MGLRELVRDIKGVLVSMVASLLSSLPRKSERKREGERRQKDRKTMGARTTEKQRGLTSDYKRFPLPSSSGNRIAGISSFLSLAPLHISPAPLSLTHRYLPTALWVGER